MPVAVVGPRQRHIRVRAPDRDPEAAVRAVYSKRKVLQVGVIPVVEEARAEVVFATVAAEGIDDRPQTHGSRVAPLDVRRHGRRELDVVVGPVEGQRAAAVAALHRLRAASRAVEAAVADVVVRASYASVKGVVRDQRGLEEVRRRRRRRRRRGRRPGIVEDLDRGHVERARVDVDLVDGAVEVVPPCPPPEAERVVRARIHRHGRRRRLRPVEVEVPCRPVVGQAVVVPTAVVGPRQRDVRVGGK